MSYILVDALNTFFRSRHAIKGDINLRIGMSMHIMLASVKKAWIDFNGSHVVFCLDGSSWRKDYYPEYKKQRAEIRKNKTEDEKEEDNLFFQAYDELLTFIKNDTNCTVLHHANLEADDLIAGWIQKFKDSNHVIVSSDSDFLQLIKDNVSCFNGVTNVLTNQTGYFNDKGKLVIDNKTRKPKEPPNPEWLLFLKCIRGDSTDNIFSAYPNVRTKKLMEAFEDRNQKGFLWNNLMLQKFSHHDGTEHRVLDDYNRNKLLIDLTQQPEHIKTLIEETIENNLHPKNISQVGMKLLKFCGKYELNKIADEAQLYAMPLSANLTL